MLTILNGFIKIIINYDVAKKILKIKINLPHPHASEAHLLPQIQTTIIPNPLPTHLLHSTPLHSLVLGVAKKAQTH
jgi:hypothetical protein